MALWSQTVRDKAVHWRMFAAVALASLLAASAGAPTACGAEGFRQGESRPAARGPVNIRSQQLEADVNANTAEFSGQVSLVDDTFTVTADRLSFFFKPQIESQNRLRSGLSVRDVTKILARGGVVIRSQGFTVSSDTAEYEPETGQATLWGRETAAARSAAPTPQDVEPSSPAGLAAGAAPSTGRVRVVLVPTAKSR